jgi:hypothetical protein
MSRLALTVAEFMGTARVYWVRDGETAAIHVRMATGKGAGSKTVRRASMYAGEIAKDAGCGDAKSGAFVSGDGRGRVEAVGVAEVPWSPDAELRLSSLGCVEAK